MCIEHRWAPRQGAGLPVSIACRSLGLLVRGKLCNISNGGALVQLQSRPPLNAPVEMILPVQPRSDARAHRLPAIVTRCEEAGIGLMFDRIEPETWASLLAQLAPVEAEGRDRAAVGEVLSRSLP